MELPPVHEHALESDAIDAGIKNKWETTRLWDSGPLVLPAERDLPVGPRGKFRICDQPVRAVYV